MKQSYLLDTHTLIFWAKRTLSTESLAFLDEHNQHGRLFLSDISFWEIAFLVQKGRIEINNIQQWRNELLNSSGIRSLTPSPTDMINSVALPLHHKDPFDRLLIAQAVAHNLVLVTRDQAIQAYDLDCLWL